MAHHNPDPNTGMSKEEVPNEVTIQAAAPQALEAPAESVYVTVDAVQGMSPEQRHTAYRNMDPNVRRAVIHEIAQRAHSEQVEMKRMQQHELEPDGVIAGLMASCCGERGTANPQTSTLYDEQQALPDSNVVVVTSPPPAPPPLPPPPPPPPPPSGWGPPSFDSKG